MSGSLKLGRLAPVELGKPVLFDLPEKTAAAIMSKQDEIIATLKALTAKLDADAGVTDVDYEALITDALVPIRFVL